jgi:hypothetical protein
MGRPERDLPGDAPDSGVDQRVKEADGFAATPRRTARTPFALIATAPLDISGLESYKSEKPAG